MLTDADIDRFRQELERRLGELDAYRTASQDSRKPVTLDQASVGRLSRMDAMQQQAMALAADRRREHERQKIKAALERIETDEFGYCLRCDEEISPDRLEFDAAITLCAACMKSASKS